MAAVLLILPVVAMDSSGAYAAWDPLNSGPQGMNVLLEAATLQERVEVGVGATAEPAAAPEAAEAPPDEAGRCTPDPSVATTSKGGQ